jgi:hypothetical protein
MISGPSRNVASRRDIGAGSVCENERRVGHSGSAGRAVCATAAVIVLTLLAAPAVGGMRPVVAQVIPKSPQQGGSQDAINALRSDKCVRETPGMERRS